jgi:hypothetical protein
MIGNLLGLVLGGTALRGMVAGVGLALLTGVCFVVAGAFAVVAAFAALQPELGTAWTAALIGGVFLACGLVALIVNRIARRRRIARRLALAQAAALAVPKIGPEMLLLAAAAGALFGLGRK